MCKNLKPLSTAAILFFACGASLAQEVGSAVSPVPELPSITRGQTVTLHADNLPPKDVKIALRTGKEKDNTDSALLDTTVAADAKSLTFKIPADHFNPDRYLVYVALPTGARLPVPGELRVLPDEGARVQIDSVFPATVYPDEYDQYTFELSGSNLGQLASDNSVDVLNVGWQSVKTVSECMSSASPRPAEMPTGPCLEYAKGMEGRKLTVRNYTPGRFSEPIQIRVKVGNNVSEPMRLTFSRVGPTTLRLWALAVTVAIAVIVLGLVWKGIGYFKINTERYSPLTAFFLDNQTNSYSLSKFQLLAWTSVAVFAYIFVYFCHVMVQWNFDFPAIPNGWPTLLGLSAATTVTAVGITVNHGSKGAGPVQPQLSDFITTGGLVATDRFQFFVWTLVGCVGFLGLVLLPDPASLATLPDVPSGFLYLMGISATGYLGGKLVRAPGPVISQLLVNAASPSAPGSPATMKIDLKGENLSKDAIVSVDGRELRKDQFDIAQVKSQVGAPDASFSTELTLALKDAESYLEGTHTLTFTNGDGQMAVSTFPIDPLSIDPFQNPVPANTTPKQVTVKGKNFADGMTGTWTTGAGGGTNIPTTDVVKDSDTQLIVTLVPGPSNPAPGTLVLISAINLRARAQVTVK